MGIVDEDIARVRAATDFVALASEHLALRRVGTRWVGLCPFHTESTPSFYVNAQEGLYHCFGCQASGDVITFVRELEQLDFVEAVEKLAGRAGITLRYDDETTSRDHQRRARVYDTVARAVEWYHARLLEAPDAAAARRYLRVERAYDGDLVRRYKLGWAPDGWEPLLRALKLPKGALVDAGLGSLDEQGRYRDFFRARLLFPIFDPSGRPIGAGGRMLPGGRPPKYKNTTGTAVYDKSSVLYGLNWAKKAIVARNRVVVCEGYTDVIGLQRAGVEEAVATCGTALADGHIRLLTKFAPRIVLAYDADAAGQAAAERVHEWERRFEVDIRVAAFPAGEDPADVARRDPEGLQRAVGDARPLVGFQLRRHFERADLASAEGRVRAAQAALGLIAAHPDPLVRDQYLMEVADRCRVPPDDLRRLAADLGRRPASPGPGGGGAGGRRRDGGGGASGGRVARPAARPGARAGGGAEREVPNRPDEPSSPDEPGGGSRSGGPGGPPAGRPAPTRPLPAPERAALVLAVQQPGDVADRLERVLLSHPLALAVFDALVACETLQEAIDAADPPVAALLTELAVSEPESSVDDVMTRVMELAGRRAAEELQAEIRAADPAEVAAWVANLNWLLLALEELRPPPPADPEAARTAEQRLLAWLVARSETIAEDDAAPGAPGGG
ncbi:MAG TPA: DNA primase [Acidimicrobiales bacterium]|nr:DNA primase [Acidimicrobiales bacterium]